MINFNATVPDILEDFPRSSKYPSLLSTIGWILRFFRNAKAAVERKGVQGEPIGSKHVDKTVMRQLTIAEIHEAEHAILRRAQILRFPKEYETILLASRKLGSQHRLNKTSLIAPLRPTMTLSERLIRVTGRIEETFDKAPAKFPILLPSSGRLTDMIIRDAHCKVFHAGARSTLAALRARFYSVKGRQRIKKTRKNGHKRQRPELCESRQSYKENDQQPPHRSISQRKADKMAL